MDEGRKEPQGIMLTRSSYAALVCVHKDFHIASAYGTDVYQEADVWCVT